jgi:translation initiation factor IF-3
MINEKCLRHREIQVVNADGKHLGNMSSREALNMARDEELDLVLINDRVTPPLCKIVNYGKMKYQENKLEKENRKHQQEVKALRLRPNIAQHDLDTLTRHAQKFLSEGDKVKVSCQFKAREMAHPELGRQKLVALAAAVAEISSIEREPVLEGKFMHMMLMPKKK